jgi:sporulation protein YlmC with PRC-barrel domain
MLINHAQLIGLPVVTQAGQALGKVDGFVLEINSHTIHQYEVKPSGIANVFSKDLLVSHEQVIDITKDKMIVDNSTIQGLGEQKSAETKSSPQAEPITSSEIS